jgi:hypothetical protein
MNESVLTLLKLQDKIPWGIYCYDENGVCPFWKLEKEFSSQENGYCYYLQRGDWYESSAISLLWDQCKECGINDDVE